MSPLIGGFNGTSVAEDAFHVFYKRAPDVKPNQFQTYTIIAAGIMFPVAGIMWNTPIMRDLILGLKMFVVGTHETFHAITGIACGGEIRMMCIDPNAGGFTSIWGLQSYVPHQLYSMPVFEEQLYCSSSLVLSLVAGYLGSSIVGFVYIFAALASKAASFTIAIFMLVPCMVADHWSAFVSIALCEGVLIGLWFGDHGNALRFYVLFVGMLLCDASALLNTGILHLFYSVWDYLDERMFCKTHKSDCTQFMVWIGGHAGAWAVVWFLLECGIFIAAVFAGIIVFRKTPEEMYAKA